MERITKRDWEIINGALALYEAEVDQDHDDRELLADIKSAREKVRPRAHPA